MLAYQRVKPQELVYSSMVCGKCTVTAAEKVMPLWAASSSAQGAWHLFPTSPDKLGLQAPSELLPT